MTPFFFGQATRRLYGIYEPPRCMRPDVRAVLFCYPWGPEYNEAHRSIRQLARMLTGAGYHSFRFDYFGTGDSGGDSTEVTIPGCIQDIKEAISELENMSAIRSISLVGLRLGATLAAMAAGQCRALVKDVVLWDPVIEGNDYIDELTVQAKRILGATPFRVRNPEAGGGLELLGHPMTAAHEREIRRLDLAAHLEELPARSVAIFTKPQPRQTSLIEVLHRRAVDVRVEYTDATPPWIDPGIGRGNVPFATLQDIMRWMD